MDGKTLETMPEKESNTNHSTWWNKVRHAFAVDSASQKPLTDAQKKLIERLSKEAVRRGMTLPVTTFLEMSRPLNFISSQALRFFQPIAAPLARLVASDAKSYEQLMLLLERRDSIDLLCEKIDEFETAQKQLRNKPRTVPASTSEHPNTHSNQE